ncbi:MAG: hypothetical protein SPK71_02385, partial [Prevotella sp.]|nr:hypothetical protein [Prevotella sp.]
MNVIEQNLFSLLRVGAFDDGNVSIVPMSTWKWNKMAYYAQVHGIWDYVRKGLDNYKADNKLNTPYNFGNRENKTKDISHNNDNSQHQNKLLLKQYRSIIEKERHSIDTSITTLQLLEIIVFNSNELLNKDLNFNGIINLGHFMREKGNAVDYIKLESWLSQLRLTRMAQLEGSVLVSVLGFDADEIPFVNTVEDSALNLAKTTIRSTTLAEEWHFRQSDNGFVVNNSKLFRRNMKRSLHFLNYAPIISISSFFYNFVHSLKLSDPYDREYSDTAHFIAEALAPLVRGPEDLTDSFLDVMSECSGGS